MSKGEFGVLVEVLFLFVKKLFQGLWPKAKKCVIHDKYILLLNYVYFDLLLASNYSISVNDVTINVKLILIHINILDLDFVVQI
jgi:hypothetical protein